MYKYLRRVPGVLHKVLDRKSWDNSLGSDLTKATVKCHSYSSNAVLHETFQPRQSATNWLSDSDCTKSLF